jgi:hypothetical protein
MRSLLLKLKRIWFFLLLKPQKSCFAQNYECDSHIFNCDLGINIVFYRLSLHDTCDSHIICFFLDYFLVLFRSLWINNFIIYVIAAYQKSMFFFTSTKNLCYCWSIIKLFGNWIWCGYCRTRYCIHTVRSRYDGSNLNCLLYVVFNINRLIRNRRLRFETTWYI